jgi:hypothetical protein
MMKRASMWVMMLGVAGICAVPAAARASDFNLLGLYVGAGVGESTVRSDSGFDPYYPVDSHPHHTAYKVLVGVRPIPFVGAEAEYIDFGHPTSADSYYNVSSGYYDSADSHPRAGVLYGVGYLPLPFVDVFAKVGEARLATNVSSYGTGLCTQITPGGTCGPSVLISRDRMWQTKVAYGAGVQAHFFGLAVRGEYERISSTFGDPDAFMVSATWTF